MRKRHACVESVGTIFATIDYVFQHAQAISQVIFILGTTIVSPKDVYIVNLPESSLETHQPSYRQSLSVFFRTVISKDWYKNAPQCKSLTKLHVLLRRSRGINCDGVFLLPRPNFKVPQRGHHFTLDLICGVSNLDQDISQIEPSDDDFNISGIDILNYSDLDSGLPQSLTNGESSLQTDTQSASNECRKDTEQDSMQMWYQVSIAGRGYRDISSKVAGPNFMRM
jgi:hypothetical protein